MKHAILHAKVMKVHVVQYCYTVRKDMEPIFARDLPLWYLGTILLSRPAAVAVSSNC